MSASEQDGNTDSAFLDMITNCVGILIVLVMIVGQHAKDLPSLLAAETLNEEITALQEEIASTEQSIGGIDVQLARLQSALGAEAAERDELNSLVMAVERQLTERRAALDAPSQADFDVARELALAEAEIKRLQQLRQQAVQASAAPTITIENYPTPLGKTVDGREAHFSLSGGRIVFVPMDALIERLKSTLHEQANRMDRTSDPEGLVDPIGGFRLRYTLDQHDRYISVSYVEFLPEPGQWGEPLDVALGRQSKFRDKLAMLSPNHYTITIWTYPDSFDEFRKIKKDLHALGYTVAARPLPQGVPIGASPHGSKSSAQ